jgi:hypothetical protein
MRNDIFLCALRYKKDDLARQLKKEETNVDHRDQLTRRIELLNIVIWEFAPKVHDNSLKNLRQNRIINLKKVL